MKSRRPNSLMARLIAHLMSFFAGGIGELEQCVARVLPATAHSRFAAIAIQIGDNHRCTFAREYEHGSASASTCRAGNDRNFRVQSAHFFLRGQTDSACQNRIEIATLGRSDGATALTPAV